MNSFSFSASLASRAPNQMSSAPFSLAIATPGEFSSEHIDPSILAQYFAASTWVFFSFTTIYFMPPFTTQSLLDSFLPESTFECPEDEDDEEEDEEDDEEDDDKDDEEDEAMPSAKRSTRQVNFIVSFLGLVDYSKALKC